MDQINNKPESQLPWTSKLYCILDADRAVVLTSVNKEYIVHASNAYPKLISMLKLLNDSSRLGSMDMVNDLLKELGEY
jgi:hypothetical protein